MGWFSIWQLDEPQQAGARFYSESPCNKSMEVSMNPEKQQQQQQQRQRQRQQQQQQQQLQQQQQQGTNKGINKVQTMYRQTLGPRSHYISLFVSTLKGTNKHWDPVVLI